MTEFPVKSFTQFMLIDLSPDRYIEDNRDMPLDGVA